MARLSPILRSAEGTGKKYLIFWCPGCDSTHTVRVRSEGTKGPSWEWNGSVDKPTFSPSILVTANFSEEDGGKEICHTFVVDGRIQFLEDCTHHLAGKTVDLPAWDKEWGGTEGD